MLPGKRDSEGRLSITTAVPDAASKFLGGIAVSAAGQVHIADVSAGLTPIKTSNGYNVAADGRLITVANVTAYSRIAGVPLDINGNVIIKTDTAIAAKDPWIGQGLRVAQTPTTLWGFTLGRLPSDVTFTRTTTATYYGKDGLLKTAAINEPRISYDPVTKECIGLLVEGARTNAWAYSNFESGWNVNGYARFDKYTATGSDGKLSMSELVQIDVGGSGYVAKNFSATAGVPFCVSVECMKGAYTQFSILLPAAYFSDGQNRAATIDFLTGTVSGGAYSIPCGAIPLGGGKYRLWAAVTPDLTVTAGAQFRLPDAVIGRSVFLARAQVEDNATFPSSYIPTQASAVLRDYDSPETPAGAWYNPVEGTWMVEAFSYDTPVAGVARSALYAVGASTADRFTMLLARASDAAPTVQVVLGGSAGYNVAGAISNQLKMVLAYKVDDCRAATNGTLRNVDTPPTPIPTITKVVFGHFSNAQQLFGYIKRAGYVPVRMPDSSLANASASQTQFGYDALHVTTTYPQPLPPFLIPTPDIEFNFSEGNFDSRITITRTTSATYFDRYGVMQTAAINEARVDFDPVTKKCLGLLVEGTKTNFFLNSEVPVTQDIAVTATPYTLSFFGTGTIALSGAHIANLVGSGAYPVRSSLTFTPTAGTLTLTLSGDVQKVQLEDGDYLTSYIPCGAAATQRTIDQPRFDGTPFTDVFNPVEGTLYSEGSGIYSAAAAAVGRVFGAFNPSVQTNCVQMYQSSATAFACAARESSANVYTNSASKSNGVFTRSAIRYKLDNYRASIDGTLLAADVPPSPVPPMSQFVFGNHGILTGATKSYILRACYWRTGLSDSVLNALTKT